MRRGVACVGDMTSGHDGYPGTRIITGSGTMVCDGRPVACVGDRCEHHNKSHGHDHVPIISDGSSFFKVDGIPVAMIGSPVNINCESNNIIISGSSTMVVDE